MFIVESDKIDKIDKNLKIETDLHISDVVWYDAKGEDFVTYGIAESEEGYLRLPEEVAKATSEGVAALFDNTSGVRVRFCTNSPYVAIKAVFSRVCTFPHMPLSGTSGFDLYREKEKRQFYLGTYIPPVGKKEGFAGVIDCNTSLEAVNYILNFPLYNPVSKLYIGLRAGSELQTPDGYFNKKPVVFYGSSITQGGCASRPGTCYQNFLSRALDMDYLCLGFSGSARGEKTIAEYMSELSMSAFVSDYDHNAPDSRYLQNTHFALYETIRKKNPDLPYIMMGHPSKGIGEPVERRKVIMESYIKALETGDKNVYFIDGDALFSGDEDDACTVDGCHPNDLGFYRMAQGILPVLKEIVYKK